MTDAGANRRRGRDEKVYDSHNAAVVANANIR